MRVKRLEIQGFKSFKDKTVIHFDESIVGIVGPNGCGKSNIVDAFFWVMGEMSYKHIRGNGSDDMIFNGSAKYTALGMAEVTLVLETSVPDTQNAPSGASASDVPFHLKCKDISITRRLYRGGEGEYLINGLPARLKDIRELFMDTGVGTKGYSVIEQGQIGKIVNSKPEDRRVLVEDAAGIAKYKARKVESQRKLEAAKANLSRLNDVILEIERNLSSLERQAQKARKYNEYKKELFDKEMTWGRRKYRLLNDKLVQIRTEKERLEQEILSLRTQLYTLETEVETAQITELAKTKVAEELQPKLQELSDEITHEQSALDLSKKRQQDLAHQIQSMQDEKAQLGTALTQEKERLELRSIEIQQFEDEHARLKAAAAALEENLKGIRLETEETRRTLDNAKNDLMKSVGESADLGSKLAGLQAFMDSGQAQLARVTTEETAISEKLALTCANEQQAQVLVQEHETQKTNLSDAISSKKNHIQDQDHLLQEAETKLDACEGVLRQHQSKLESLEELDRLYEGLANGPKTILDWAKNQTVGASVRVLADSFHVQRGYEEAVAGWLESNLDRLFVNDVAVAMSSLEFIRSQRAGRAAISIPMHGRPEQNAAMDFLALQSLLSGCGFEVLGPLSQFVELTAESEVAGSVSALLGRTCLVRSLSPLQSLLGSDLSALSGWALIAVDGTVFEADGTLRGGSTFADTTANILGRRRAIEEIREKITVQEAALAEIIRNRDGLAQAMDASRNELHTLELELRECELKLVGLNHELQQVERSRGELEKLQGVTLAELTRLHNSIEQSKQEQIELNATLSEHQERRKSLEISIAKSDSSLIVHLEKLRNIENELQNMRINEASSREKALSLARELQMHRSMITDRESRIAEIDRLLDRIAQERDRYSGSDVDILSKIEALTRTRAETESKFNNLRGEISTLRVETKQGQERIRVYHQDIDVKTTALNESAVETERASGELAFLVQNLDEKYGHGCLEQAAPSGEQVEMDAPVVTTEMTAEEEQLLNEEVERLRERIRRLGEVNPMAVEEFEKETARHTELTDQRTDLTGSIENLEAAIEHINHTSEDRFRKAFESIANRFEKLFPIIFGGGKANLSLVYPEDSQNILDAGIEIFAQPPGKNVVNISLLSGGEKALTALALVFAIFMVKPSPFCILDEVDAPLDDANIGKFNTLLREMAIKTQFILITHNKKTMELNDTLYGITMEEPGVSRVVSIQLQ